MSEPGSPPTEEQHPATHAPIAPAREAPPPEAADQERIRAEREQYARDRELWVAEREQTRQWQRQVESRLPPPPQPVEPDLDKIWYENPRLAKELIAREIKGELYQTYRQEQEAQRREKVMADFVGGMYEAHPELRGEDHLVAYVLQRDGDAIGAAKIADGREMLARGVREEILRMEKRASEWRTREEGSPPPPAHRATVEGGSGSRSQTPRPAEEPGAKSITDLIRQRREARENARHGARRTA